MLSEVLVSPTVKDFDPVSSSAVMNAPVRIKPGLSRFCSFIQSVCCSSFWTSFRQEALVHQEQMGQKESKVLTGIKPEKRPNLMCVGGQSQHQKLRRDLRFCDVL